MDSSPRWFGMTPMTTGCVVVCSQRRKLADRHLLLPFPPTRAGGSGMTPWCVILVCSWRRILADSHSLPFPWTLSFHRRWCPSASHHPLTFIFLPARTFPLPFPFLSLGLSLRRPWCPSASHHCFPFHSLVRLCRQSPWTCPVSLLHVERGRGVSCLRVKINVWSPWHQTRDIYGNKKIPSYFPWVSAENCTRISWTCEVQSYILPFTNTHYLPILSFNPKTTGISLDLLENEPHSGACVPSHDV